MPRKRSSPLADWEREIRLSDEHQQWLKAHRAQLGPKEPSLGPPSLHDWKEEEVGQAGIPEGAGIRLCGNPKIGPDGLRYYLISQLYGCDRRNARRRILAARHEVPVLRWKERYGTPYIAHPGTLPESDNPVLIPVQHADTVLQFLHRVLRRRDDGETYTTRLSREVMASVKVPYRGHSGFRRVLRDVRVILKRMGARKNQHGEYLPSRSSTKQVLGRFFVGFGARRKADEGLYRFLRVPRRFRDHISYSAVCNWKATVFPPPRK